MGEGRFAGQFGKDSGKIGSSGGERGVGRAPNRLRPIKACVSHPSFPSELKVVSGEISPDPLDLFDEKRKSGVLLAKLGAGEGSWEVEAKLFKLAEVDGRPCSWLLA